MSSGDKEQLPAPVAPARGARAGQQHSEGSSSYAFLQQQTCALIQWKVMYGQCSVDPIAQHSIILHPAFHAEAMPTALTNALTNALDKRSAQPSASSPLHCQKPVGHKWHAIEPCICPASTCCQVSGVMSTGQRRDLIILWALEQPGATTSWISEAQQQQQLSTVCLPVCLPVNCLSVCLSVCRSTVYLSVWCH